MLDHARVVLATAKGALVLATYRRPWSVLTFAEIRERARRWAAGARADDAEAERGGPERARSELDAEMRTREGPALAAVAAWVPQVERVLLVCAEAMHAQSPSISHELLGLRAASDRLEGALARVTKGTGDGGP